MEHNKILITGCTGHLGKYVVEKLREEKYNFICLSKEDSQELNVLKEKYACQIIFCDLTQEENIDKLKKKLSEISCVIHLAGFVPKHAKEDNLEKTITGNLFATINLAKAVPKKTKFIFASTCEVYGEPVVSPILENRPLCPLSYYGLSKVAAEQALQIYCENNEIPLTILRFTNIYGPGEKIERAIPNFIKAVLNGERPKMYGDGSDKRDFLYATDAANYVLAAMQKGKNKTYNIAYGKSVTIKEIAEKILQISGSPMKIDFQERRKLAMNYVFDVSQAQEDMDYTPQVELEEGLLKEIEWYRENKKRIEEQSVRKHG